METGNHSLGARIYRTGTGDRDDWGNHGGGKEGGGVRVSEAARERAQQENDDITHDPTTYTR